VHVASLRKKLGHPEWIETVRRVGLRLGPTTGPPTTGPSITGPPTPGAAPPGSEAFEADGAEGR